MENNKRILSSLKSYLEFDVNGHKRLIYAISEVRDGWCQFEFHVNKAGACKWHLSTDFAIRVADVSCTGANLTGNVEPSDDAREVIASLTAREACQITVQCHVEAMTEAETIQMMKREYGNRVAHIDMLLQRERDLLAHEQDLLAECQQLRDSRAYRLGSKIAAVYRFFAPKGSKRAKLLSLLATILRHPVKFLSKISIRNIKRVFRMLCKGNLSGIGQLIRSGMAGGDVSQPLQITPPDIVPIDLEQAKDKKKEDYKILRVPQWENPQVSIIIPVYNQFVYTYHCVQSVVKNSGGITYEILIANDCSTDLTTQIEDILPGVRCITTPENLRFVRNCNNAAKYARGKYILLLNNDTQVLENWLEPLVSLIERKEDIGMVGSKLINPDGTLQEAGGILWKDGSAWNFGRGQNPALPQFNYVKEADYISGAAIMIHRWLWEKIGGFDELFAPAYCDDSDLAFTVRKMGYRVMFQPKSVVVHFEGVTNGTDTSSGQKQYQIENSQKLQQKWARVFAEHPENGEDVFHARDRSYGKKTVVMIDHYVPMYDKDAGSRTIYQYVKLLVELGYNVKFIGDNFCVHQPYTEELEQMGVEVLYGQYYMKNWKSWVLENKDELDVVFMNRPHITEKYIDFFKKHTDAKIIYNLCDLYFLREQREYEVTGDKKLRDSAAQWKARELALVEKADTVFSLSMDEKKILDQYAPQDKTVICPIFIYETFAEKLPERNDTQDLLFVGGFNHHPNVDAVKWFCSDVLPLIQKRIADVKLHVVGSNPPAEIQELQSSQIIIEGFVPDEKLLQLYSQCRVCVIPLRYGAGVKGKTIEAMYNGIPIVTTSSGIEGLPDIEFCISAYDDAQGFADEVVNVYVNGDGGCTQKCYEFVKAHYSLDAAKDFFRKEFQ